MLWHNCVKGKRDAESHCHCWDGSIVVSRHQVSWCQALRQSKAYLEWTGRRDTLDKVSNRNITWKSANRMDIETVKEKLLRSFARSVMVRKTVAWKEESSPGFNLNSAIWLWCLGIDLSTWDQDKLSIVQKQRKWTRKEKYWSCDVGISTWD